MSAEALARRRPLGEKRTETQAASWEGAESTGTLAMADIPPLTRHWMAEVIISFEHWLGEIRGNLLSGGIETLTTTSFGGLLPCE